MSKPASNGIAQLPGVSSVRPREPRRKVQIDAHMRVSAAWAPISILNISPHGLLLKSFSAPAPGTYAEVRRGQHVVVARVAWSDGHHFGVSTQDPLSVDQLVDRPDLACGCGSAAAPAGEVPIAARSGEVLADRSRTVSRRLEFAFAALVALGGAAAAGGLVHHTLGQPFAFVSKTLGRP